VRLQTVAAICLWLLIGVGGVAGASRTASAPIKVHLTLHQDHVVAGQAIKATVLITNPTPRPIIVKTCARDGWLQVGLHGHGYTYEASSLLIKCAPSIRLTPGANRFSVRVQTRYQSCTQPGGQSDTPTHMCTPSGPPALPAGKYSTIIDIAGIPLGQIQKAQPVTVTLLPAAS
jgi:hypothetical protein